MLDVDKPGRFYPFFSFRAGRRLQSPFLKADPKVFDPSAYCVFLGKFTTCSIKPHLKVVNFNPATRLHESENVS
jgi:hypothetical protein